MKKQWNSLMDKKYLEHLNKSNDHLNKIYQIGPREEINDPELKEKLIKEASKDSKIIRGKGDFCITGKYIPEDLKEPGKKSVIGVSDYSGPDALAHEMGHALNNKSLNPVTRIVHKHGPGMIKKMKHSDLLKSTGLKEYLVVSEEKKASKNGRKILKKHGASESIMKASRKNMDRALEIYRRGEKSEKERSRAYLYNSMKIK